MLIQTRPRYQVSVYRTIGSLVLNYYLNYHDLLICSINFVVMSTTGSDLADQLHKWAVEEMHFYSHGLDRGKMPTVDDFRM